STSSAFAPVVEMSIPRKNVIKGASQCFFCFTTRDFWPYTPPASAAAFRRQVEEVAWRKSGNRANKHLATILHLAPVRRAGSPLVDDNQGQSRSPMHPIACARHAPNRRPADSVAPIHPTL